MHIGCYLVSLGFYFKFNFFDKGTYLSSTADVKRICSGHSMAYVRLSTAQPDSPVLVALCSPVLLESAADQNLATYTVQQSIIIKCTCKVHKCITTRK